MVNRFLNSVRAASDITQETIDDLLDGVDPNAFILGTYYSYFKHSNGNDYHAAILKLNDQLSPEVYIQRLNSLEDIPFHRCLIKDLTDIPDDMFDRLLSKTRNILEIINEKFNLRQEVHKLKDQIEALNDARKSDSKLMFDIIEGFKEQKRIIKKKLLEMGIKIEPGSELSKLLRLDNVPYPHLKNTPPA